jgi:hypothetical protein
MACMHNLGSVSLIDRSVWGRNLIVWVSSLSRIASRFDLQLLIWTQTIVRKRAERDLCGMGHVRIYAIEANKIATFGSLFLLYHRSSVLLYVYVILLCIMM